MVYATPEQYEKRVAGTLTDARREQVADLLEDASELIDSHLAKGWKPPPGLARGIVCAIVRRAVANPGGVRQKTVGQTSESYGEKGGLYITEEEIRDLHAAYERHTGWDADSYTVMPHDPGLNPPGWWR